MTPLQSEFYAQLDRRGLLGCVSETWWVDSTHDCRVHGYLVYQPGKDTCLLVEEQPHQGAGPDELKVSFHTANWDAVDNEWFACSMAETYTVAATGISEAVWAEVAKYLGKPTMENIDSTPKLLEHMGSSIRRVSQDMRAIQSLLEPGEFVYTDMEELPGKPRGICYRSILDPALHKIAPQAFFPESRVSSPRPFCGATFVRLKESLHYEIFTRIEPRNGEGYIACGPEGLEIPSALRLFRGVRDRESMLLMDKITKMREKLGVTEPMEEVPTVDLDLV